MANQHTAPPILLTIAGFDPSCGAGVAADLKTFAAHGCYGIAAITSLTVQNTQKVDAVHNTPSAELREQLEVLVCDCEIAAVKVGMLGNRGNAVVVAEFLDAQDQVGHLQAGQVFLDHLPVDTGLLGDLDDIQFHTRMGQQIDEKPQDILRLPVLR